MGSSKPWPGMTRRAFIESAAAAAFLAACGNPADLAASPGAGPEDFFSRAMASASKTSQAVYRIPNSIPSDGSREVSQDINDWIRSIPNGTASAYNRAAFATSGTYWVDDTIEPFSKSYIAFAGNGSTFVRRNQLPGTASVVRARAHWRFNQCAWFTYDDLHVDGQANPWVGYNSALEAQHAFTHTSSVQSVSTNCTAKNVWGDAFNFACNSSGLPSAHHNVGNFTSGIVHRQSVSITTGDDITFSSCNFGRSWRSGVDLEPNSNSGRATHILFEDCTWKAHRLLWLAAAPRCGVVSDVTMSRCTDSSPLTVAVTCDPTFTDASGITPRRANFTIDSCTSTAQQGGPSGAAMDFHFTDGLVTVTNNVQPLQPGRTPPMRVARFDPYTTAKAVITYEGNTPDLG
jgi:hypothetical protein